MIAVFFAPFIDTLQLYPEFLAAALDFRGRTPCFAQSEIEGEAQKIKHSTFFAITQFEVNDMRLLFVEFEFVLRQSFVNDSMDTFGILTVLAADDRVIPEFIYSG